MVRNAQGHGRYYSPHDCAPLLPTSPRTDGLACHAQGLCRTRLAAHAGAGLLGGAATAAGIWHTELLAARGRGGPHHHRIPELGRPGLWFQVGLVAAGGPPANPRAHPLAGPAAQLAAAVAS